MAIMASLIIILVAYVSSSIILTLIGKSMRYEVHIDIVFPKSVYSIITAVRVGKTVIL